MAFFALNGYPCIDVDSARRHAEEAGIDTSEWEGLANSFTHRVGSDPSFGYFLVQNESVVGTLEEGLRIDVINIDDSVTTRTFGTVQIEYARKYGPSATESDGFYFVKVVDERFTLQHEIVGYRYNLVNGFTKSSEPNTDGSFDINADTFLVHFGLVRATWIPILAEAFRVNSASFLGSPTDAFDYSEISNDGGATIPSLPPYETPHDLDFRYVTRRNAVEKILQLCNYTLVPSDSGGEGGYKIVFLRDDDNAQRDAVLNDLVHRRIDDVHPKEGIHGREAFRKIISYFRELYPDDPEVSVYHKNEFDVVDPEVSYKVEDLHVRLPLSYVDEESIPDGETIDAAVTDFYLRTSYFWKLFPSQEKTYHDFVNVALSDHIQQITWYDFGGGPRTTIVTALSRNWLLAPDDPEDTGETAEALQEIFGMLIDDVPAADVNYVDTAIDAGSSYITPGTAGEAVIPLEKRGDASTGAHIFAAQLDDEDKQVRLLAVNSIYPQEIKAGTSNDSDKPVVVRGYIDDSWDWNNPDGSLETVRAFIITNVIYPVTIVQGTTLDSVPAAPSPATFRISVDRVLWGRDPEVDTYLDVANPDEWDADAGAYCLAMQITDGTWQAIDLACVPPTA